MTEHAHLFSNPLAGFSFHLLIGEAVMGVTCPKRGKSIPGGRTAKDFDFDILGSPSGRMITVRATDIFLASTYEGVDKQLVIVRAAAKALREGIDLIQVGTGNFTEFCSDPSLMGSVSQLRQGIVDYIVDRYEIEFEPPFSVLELFVGFPSHLDTLLKQLRYLEKHGYITATKQAGVWGRGEIQDSRDELVRILSVTNLNLEKLQDAKSDRRVHEPRGATQTQSQMWDFFICHASEDKSGVVEPLAAELRGRGFRIWLDKWTLSVGDILLKKIDQGLASSRYGIVVLSRSFFGKDWPETELYALLQKEIGGEKVILPVWHDVDSDDVKRYSPILAGRFAANTRDGIPQVASLLADVIENDSSTSPTPVQTSGPQVADVAIERRDIEIHDALHVYGLVVRAKLNCPPDQSRLKLKIRWPFIVPISKTAGIEQIGRSVVDGSVESLEFVVNWEQRVFPGEEVCLLGGDPEHCFEYKFTDTVWKAVWKQDYMVEYTLYFEDHEPVSGLKPINDLHVY